MEVVWAGMLWYYVSDEQERLAVPEERMGALAGSGVLRPTTLIWRKGMPQWVSAGELMPEIFGGLVWGATGEDVGAGRRSDGERGLVTELALTLRSYAGWVAAAGWAHGAVGVLCLAMAVALGWLAWMRPERLAAGVKELPENWRVFLEHPFWMAGGMAAGALLLFFMAGQLVGSAAGVRRAEHLQSGEELKVALRSMGSFFRWTVIMLVLVVLSVMAAFLFHYRPWKNQGGETPAPPAPPVKERVTI